MTPFKSTPFESYIETRSTRDAGEFKKVLDEAKKQTVYDEYPSAVNVYTITEYVNEDGSILNPDGGDLSDYAQLYDTVNEATKKVAYKLRESKFQED